MPFLFFIPVRIPAWLVLGSWFVLQWVYSAGYAASGAGSVAYVAHVFGFLFGVLVGLVVRAASPPTQYPVHPGCARSEVQPAAPRRSSAAAGSPASGPVRSGSCTTIASWCTAAHTRPSSNGTSTPVSESSTRNWVGRPPIR